MTMRYSLAVIRNRPEPIIAIEIDEDFYPLDQLVPGSVSRPETGLFHILQDWERAQAAISRALEDGIPARLDRIARPGSESFEAPISYPGKIICTGTNYYDHLRKDMNIHDFDKSKFDILYFMKHSKAMVGSGAVRYPGQSVQLDWEVELAVVFGRRGRKIPVEDAMEYVAGYAVGMDLSARDWQFNGRHPKQFDLVGGKSFDDSSPLGPRFVPACFVDPNALDLKLWVNGDLKQDSSTDEMIWSIAEQISELSQVMTIEPGDVLYTGSPGGVGFPSRTFLKPGDRVEGEISGLGRLAIHIVPDPDEARARRL
jgi:2,4-didehydro-3-deoxy-L-rhamnonate hydrolase